MLAVATISTVVAFERVCMNVRTHQFKVLPDVCEAAVLDSAVFAGAAIIFCLILGHIRHVLDVISNTIAGSHWYDESN